MCALAVCYADRFAAAAIVAADTLHAFSKAVESGLLWALAAVFWRCALEGGRIPSAYFATAAFILAVSMWETSYLLAYHENLRHASRRALMRRCFGLNLRIRLPWWTSTTSSDATTPYGHDTEIRCCGWWPEAGGDGGARLPMRRRGICDVFPGKTRKMFWSTGQLRASIERAAFGARHRKIDGRARGPDRRNQRAGGELNRTRDSQLAPRGRPTVSVTASIG